MAKFCTKCGKQLEEGQVCDCQNNVAVSQTVATTSNTSSKIDIKESLMDCVNVFKKIFTKPVETIKEFVCDNKFIAGIIMIVVAAISAGIYKIATLKNMYSASNANSFNLGDFSDLLNSALSGGSIAAKPAYFKEFLNTFAISLVEYGLIVLLGYLIVSKILKGVTTWKQMIAAVAVSLSVVLTANLINSVLVFINGDFIGNIRSYITSFASILSMLILYKSVDEVSQIDKNKVFMSVASMSVFATVIIDVAKKIFK